MLKPVSSKKSDGLDDKALNGRSSANDIENTSVSGLADAPRFVTPTHGGVDILKLLSELEDVVEQTKRLPGGIMLRFDEDKFQMTIMKIRANLPEELKRASKLMRDSEKLVEEAQKSATTEVERTQRELSLLKQGAEKDAGSIRSKAQMERDGILEQARQQAAQMVSDSEIVQRAQIEAQEVLRRAEGEARTIQQGADDYAREVLGNLENVLGKAVAVVQRGREVLEKPNPKR